MAARVIGGQPRLTLMPGRQPAGYDGSDWPHHDGLKWPHRAVVVAAGMVVSA
jgi:hypothetical protein